MHVLEVCRTFLDDDTVVYAEPVVCGA